jgi:hypothetical protein
MFGLVSGKFAAGSACFACGRQPVRLVSRLIQLMHANKKRRAAGSARRLQARHITIEVYWAGFKSLNISLPARLLI